MKIIKYPAPDTWQQLLKRPTMDVSSLMHTVEGIMQRVRDEGDQALYALAQQFDGVQLQRLAVTSDELAHAATLLSPALKEAIQLAYHNIRTFHEAQRFAPITVTTMPGVTCTQKALPINSVGLYIPGGSAPLFSTVLMLATPAQIAGCQEIILCTPPAKDGSVHPAIRYAAHLAGVHRIYKVGGAQAIAAMTLGTETIPAVDKIFGPGNQYVTAAKQLATLQGTAIDMPAGPSEVAVIADETSNADFVAADLLSQAEHGADSQAVLFTTSEEMLQAVKIAVKRQLTLLPRLEIATKALEHCLLILVQDKETLMQLTNTYAPEHLVIAVQDYQPLADAVTNAGSVFLGLYSCESAGDYASGTNHTLPTNGYARAYSGLNLDSFTKKITFQHLSAQGVRHLAPAVEAMAEAEQLQAHQYAMTIRRLAIEDNV